MFVRNRINHMGEREREKISEKKRQELQDKQHQMVWKNKNVAIVLLHALVGDGVYTFGLIFYNHTNNEIDSHVARK